MFEIIKMSKMSIYDSHMHVGQFYDKYYSPSFLAGVISSFNIKKVLISSTTTCEENYIKVISEIKQLIALSKEKILPVLWVTPKMLKSNKLSYMLESGIKWECIKIHGFIHNWPPNGKLFQRVIELAIKMQLPILIHSGGDKKCDAGSYLKVIKRNPKQIFILAHGRPIGEALNVIKQCHNAYVDTAFMPVEDILFLIENNVENKILFGTDFPITIHYDSKQNANKWYEKRLLELTSIMTEQLTTKIFKKNFDVIFKG